LLPGIYHIRAEQAGFKSLVVKGVRLEINQNVTQDPRLEVGAVTESIAVSGTAPTVDMVSGSVEHVVENKGIVEQPLNGRNVFDLVNSFPRSGWIRTRLTSGTGTILR
jgi:hypothetical protein